MGAFYAAVAGVLGGVFLYYAVRTLREAKANGAARTTFLYSLLYLALICASMVIDRIRF
jgi:protoheme IX farnesyltransferase